jgi:hypothetical protein
MPSAVTQTDGSGRLAVVGFVVCTIHHRFQRYGLLSPNRRLIKPGIFIDAFEI